MISWKGTCFDDGTGRNVYFVDENGNKFRKTPDDYVPEFFPLDESDEQDTDPVFGCLSMRRYYFRGSCIRCRQTTPAIFIPRSSFEKAFSLNYCAKCIVLMTPGIHRISGNGDEIWKQNIDVPKHYLGYIKKAVLDQSRDSRLAMVAKDAQLQVKTQAKLRRNASRLEQITIRAADYMVFKGQLLSWGFGDVFDEYYGAVDAKGVPSGRGIKFYNDGSIYVGDFLNGMHHTSTGKGMWIRRDCQYEGQWMKGQKHGSGRQTFPDGVRPPLILLYSHPFSFLLIPASVPAVYLSGGVREGIRARQWRQAISRRI